MRLAPIITTIQTPRPRPPRPITCAQPTTPPPATNAPPVYTQPLSLWSLRFPPCLPSRLIAYGAAMASIGRHPTAFCPQYRIRWISFHEAPTQCSGNSDSKPPKRGLPSYFQQPLSFYATAGPTIHQSWNSTRTKTPHATTSTPPTARATTTVLLQLPATSPSLPAAAATAKSPNHADVIPTVVAATTVATITEL